MAEDDKKEDAPEGEENTESTEGTDGEEAPKSKKKLFIIIGGAVALVLIIVAVLFLFVLKPSGGDEAAENSADTPTEGQDITEMSAEDIANAPSVYKDLPQMSINLLTDRGNRFLKIKIALEYAGPVDEAKYMEALPRIEDDLNTYLRQRRPDDFKGSANIYKLKEDLILRLSQTSHPLRLKNVLFRELVVQ